MQDAIPYLKQRAPLLIVGACLGVVSTLGASPAPSDDLQGLEEVLGAHGVAVTGVAWEPSRGVVGDFFLGRPVLYEGVSSDDPGGLRDIYRAFVRLSPEGRVLSVRSNRNLTGTKSADEHNLGSRGELAWFGGQGHQSPSSITFLNLKGEATDSTRHSILERLQLGISRLLETGTWAGLGRADLLSDGQPLSVQVGDEVQIRVDGAAPVPLGTRDLFTNTDEKAPHTGFHMIPRTREPSNWLHWGADAGRHIVGSGAIAWAEGRAFSLWDSLKQAGYSVSSGTTPAEPTPLATPRFETAGSVWPPTEITAPLKGKESDGKWRPIRNELLPEGGPPLFYRTLLHPDPERPYGELHLVAFDMRRLQLGIGAGYEDPHPDTGPPGSGQVPDDAGKRVVATFNGAFKSVHGQYGMKAEGRLLVEPVTGAASVRIDASGSAGLGTWSADDDPADLIAFRQNLEPLVAEGKANPRKRKVWGDQLYGSGVAVERSALCYHSSGQLLYAWATEATGESLARGLTLAGCVYAIHLDMNPGHCAFMFNKVDSVKPLVAHGKPLDPRMRVNPTRFIRWSPKDFFYLMLRESAPSGNGISWKPAPGQGPPPEDIIALFTGKKSVGGLEIEFDRVDTSRLSFSLAPGSGESKGEVPSSGEKGSPLVAWGLGHKTRGTRTGLTMGKSVVVPLHRNYASLVLEEGQLALLPPAEPQTERDGVQIAQLPTLARGGELLPRARELGGKRMRAALCLDGVGTLYTARMLHDTPAPLAQALVDLGCDLVVEMDRGSHPPPLVERAGTESPPHEGYEQTMLHGHAAPMRPKTHLF